ncbi:TetR/AcrR family transcriptional regulator, partial [Rhodococcus erythropolis]|nr:TetR/AcrR family transcriptional regulator [Rhodococcus erythropolis]
ELVSPLLIASRRNDENTGIYQREVLFGEPSECFRAEGLELSQRLQTRIAQILLEGNPNHTTRTITAARTISNVL